MLMDCEKILRFSRKDAQLCVFTPRKVGWGFQPNKSFRPNEHGL